MKRFIILLLCCTLFFSACSSAPDKETKSVREENVRIQEEAQNAYENGGDYWENVKPNYQKVDPSCVYWVEKGYAYHSTPDCVALLNSKNIQHGSLNKAKQLGHDHPCSKCVGEK